MPELTTVQFRMKPTFKFDLKNATAASGSVTLGECAARSYENPVRTLSKFRTSWLTEKLSITSHS
jgi:hypothetical protein